MQANVGGSDNVKRGVRTAGQVILGLLATGALDQIWKSYGDGHGIDPTINVAMILVLSGVAGWAVNMIEDKVGRGLLVPVDREIGDAVMDKGVGAKKIDRGNPVAGLYKSDVAGMRPMHRTQHRA